jgi:ribosome-binding factor A
VKQYRRSDRLQEQILRELGSTLDQELLERFKGLVSFTRVRLSNDLRNATIYYSYLGNPDVKERLAAYFEDEKGHIRSLIGKGLTIRHIPELLFKFDPSIEEGIHMEELFKQMKNGRDEE